MKVTHRERDRDTGRGRGRSRLHAPGVRRGIRSWVFRITPWAKGRYQTAAPPRDPVKEHLTHVAHPDHSERTALFLFGKS